jgi:hypothetical protein
LTHSARALLIVAKLVVEKLLRVLGIVSMLFFIAYGAMVGAIPLNQPAPRVEDY